MPVYDVTMISDEELEQIEARCGHLELTRLCHAGVIPTARATNKLYAATGGSRKTRVRRMIAPTSRAFIPIIR